VECKCEGNDCEHMLDQMHAYYTDLQNPAVRRMIANMQMSKD
jgi:hypothetical protein